MRGLRRSGPDEGAALLAIVFGRFSLGSLICFDFFRFGFVHHGDGYFVFSSGPIAQVAFSATGAAEWEFCGGFGINWLLTNRAF